MSPIADYRAATGCTIQHAEARYLWARGERAALAAMRVDSIRHAKVTRLAAIGAPPRIVAAPPRWRIARTLPAFIAAVTS